MRLEKKHIHTFLLAHKVIFIRIRYSHRCKPSFKFNFNIACFSETLANKNPSFQLPNYNIEHQIRKSGKGGSVCIFIHESLNYKVRKDKLR